MQVQPGLYRHYKGADYRVIGVAQHSETGEQLVAYQALYGAYGLWVRPLSMFSSTVLLGGVAVPRFALIKAETPVFCGPQAGAR